MKNRRTAEPTTPARRFLERRLTGNLFERPVHRSPLVTIRDVHCCAPRGAGSHAQSPQADELVFPRRGAFLYVCGGEEGFADSGSVVFFRRGEEYSTSHPIDGGDDCSGFVFAPAVLSAALGEESSAEPRSFGAMPYRRTGALDARACARIQALRARLALGLADDLEADETALAILAASAAALLGPKASRQRTEAARRRRAIVHDTRAVLARDHAQRMPLDELAAHMRLSPFHLARIFARETGTTIHRHQIRLRLQAALDRLGAGAEDLTTLALELGFASHSHFTDSFRREFGIPPSSFRRQLQRGRAHPGPVERRRRST